MKKENILLFLSLFVAVLLVVQGCSKDFNSVASDLTNEKQEKDINACLVFNSPKEILDFLDDGTLTKSIQPSVQPDQFISMCETADVDVLQMLDAEIPVNVEPSKLTYYDILSYDRYVPNENLAKLLNVRGEIQVGDLIYRITEAGTFYYPPSRQEEVNAQIIELSVKTGVMVDEDLYELGNGIYRFDTFSDDGIAIEDSISFNFPHLDDWDLDGDDSEKAIFTYASNFNVPGADKFPIYTVNANTVAGKGLESMFGRNKAYHQKFSKKRRLKGKLYYYKYVFYSEMGAKVKSQKRKVFWKQSTASELVLGWRNVILELDLNIPQNSVNTFPQNTQPAFAGYKDNVKIPGLTDRGTCMTIFNLEISNEQFQKALKKGSKALIGYLRDICFNGRDINRDDVNSLTILNKNKVYTVVVDEVTRKTNAKKIVKKFDGSIQLGISVNALNLPASYADWAKDVFRGTDSVPKFKIKQGEVLIAGRLDNNWVGMILKKK